jgi:hypothetical protein
MFIGLLNPSLHTDYNTLRPALGDGNSHPCSNKGNIDVDNSGGLDEKLQELEAAITRLLGHASNRSVLFSKLETRKIVNDMEKVFDFIEIASPSSHGEKRMYNFRQITTSKLTEADLEDLKRSKGILISTPSIALSENGQYMLWAIQCMFNANSISHFSKK